jgi:hypothetical protein
LAGNGFGLFYIFSIPPNRRDFFMATFSKPHALLGQQRSVQRRLSLQA